MDLIGSTNWERYKNIIYSAHDTFNQAEIIWKRSKGGLDRNGEDNETERFENITLKCLVDYNYIRKWPINQTTKTGELDRQTEVIIINLEYLKNLGYLTVNGNFNYNPTSDRFIHKGVTYKDFGSTDISQAHGDPLHFMLVLQRDDLPTGSKLP